MTNEKRYRFNDPMDKSLGAYIKDAGEHYPLGKLKMGIATYKLSPTITVSYPTFEQDGIEELDVQEVKDLVQYTKDLNEYKLSQLASEAMDF